MAQAAMVAGPVMSAVGSIYQGNSNAAISTYNAQVATQSAQISEDQGAEQERRAILQSNKVLGTAQAAYGASGVSSTGSAMDVMRSSAANAELNALTVKYNADIKATAYLNEAALDSYRATNDKISGYLGAASAVAGGASRVASAGGGVGQTNAPGSAGLLNVNGSGWAGPDSSSYGGIT